MTSTVHDRPGETADVFAAVDALLGLDLGVFDDAALQQLMTAVEHVRARIGVVSADVLGEWSRRRVWESNGSLTPGHRYAKETRSSVATGTAEVRRSRLFAELPHTRRELLAGRLSWDHVALFQRAAGAGRRALFLQHEEMLVAMCVGVPYVDAEVLVKRWMSNADEELQKDRRARGGADPASTLYASRTADDRVVVNGDLGRIDGEIVTNELDRLVDRITTADRAAGRQRTPAERRAAALVEMATRSATAPADGRRPQPLFSIIIGATEFEQLCELERSSAQVRTEQLLPYLDDAMIESILFDGRTTVVGVSQRRSIHQALRRAIVVRDRRCQHSSECDVPAAKCDGNHEKTWADGGTTHQFNVRSQCHPHNRIARLHGPGLADEPPGRPVTSDDLEIARVAWRLQRTGVVHRTELQHVPAAVDRCRRDRAERRRFLHDDRDDD